MTDTASSAKDKSGIISRRLLWVAFFLTLAAFLYVWVRPAACSGLMTTDELSRCHKKHGIWGSETVSLSLRVLLTISLCLVILKLFRVDVIPILTLFGICVAGAGFALREILSDYVCGIGMLMGGVVQYNDHVVVFLHARPEPSGPVRVDRFHPFFLEATSIDRTSVSAKVLIRYSQIDRLDRLLGDEDGQNAGK